MKIHHYQFENPPLPYAYDGLEPYIDTKTMELHHDRHLQTYVDNLNKALADCKRLQPLTLEQLICIADRLPPKLGRTIRNNAGGVYNHVMYFNGMTIENEPTPYEGNGVLIKRIIKTFGSMDNFYKLFKEQALSVFGSGYAWLVMDKCDNLSIITTANQDTPLPQNLCPILVIDVWEHAYYLKHYNKRADYIDDWFHAINWNVAEQRMLSN